MKLINKDLILMVLLVLSFKELSAQEEYTVLKTFAQISDYGCGNSNAESVATLVKGWNPEIIISTGDDNYAQDASCANNIDENVGKYFADYIYPYTTYKEYDRTKNTYSDGNVNASYRSASAPDYNRFYSVPGNHDFESGLLAWLDYFQHNESGQHPNVTYTNGPGGNRKFYDFKFSLGSGESIHFFGLNIWQRNSRSGCPDQSLTTEPCKVDYYDEINEGSPQYKWLRDRLKLSTATYKIVFMHQGPYSSKQAGDPDFGLANVLKRWKFAEWGADAVLSGNDHYFETNYRNYIPFITNGLGGHSKRTVRKQYRAPGNLIYYGQEYGAVKIEAIQWTQSMKKDMRFAFYTHNGELIWQYFLEGNPKSMLAVDQDSHIKLKVSPSSAIEVTSSKEVTGSSSNQVTFNSVDHSYLEWSDLMMVDNLGLDPSGDGYTISFEVKPGSINARDINHHYVFWMKDAKGTVLSSLKRIGKNLYMNRYIDFSYPLQTWSFKLWKQDVFESNDWHTVILSVKEDMIRIKVYKPNENSSDWGPHGYGGNTELIYFGGQSLDNVKSIGFGNIKGRSTSTKSVDAIKGFKVYDRAVNYKKMDEYYLAENPAENFNARIAEDEFEEPLSTKTNSDFNQILYPNPASTHFTISIHTEEEEEVGIEMISLLGVLVHSKDFYPIEEGNYEVSVDLSSLALSRGIYMVKVRKGNESEMFKIFIE